MRSPRRLAMIGLDAADLGFIRSSVGSLPNLRRVLEEGPLQRLDSPAHLLTGSVWPTFSTATDPGEHGIYHHLQWDASRMRLRRVAADWLDYEPFWYEIARRGSRVVAVDVPMAFAPRLPDAVEVVNWGAHDQLGPLACSPRSLERELRRRFGTHPMGWEIPVGKSATELEEIRDNLVRGARRKGGLVRWLLERQPWDFFITVFGETHRGGHILWPESSGTGSVPEGALLDVYRAVDEALGEVLSTPALAGAGVIVFALHGMEANPSQEHFLPALMDRVNARFAGAGAPAGTPAPTGRRGIVRRLRESVPPAIQNRIAQAVPVAVRDAVVNRSIVAGHDWRRTPGFDLLTDLNGYLRLNVRGREREGAYERDGEVLARYVSWIRECFGSLRVSGSNEPVVAGVRRTAEVFPGRRVDHLPDLVVRWSGHPPVTRVTSPVIGDVSAELATGRSGNHHREGFCVPAGPGAPLPPLANGRELASFVVRSFA
jgi:predicted AlkP superfamily phosphohydrolase/phosphomutase